MLSIASTFFPLKIAPMRIKNLKGNKIYVRLLKLPNLDAAIILKWFTVVNGAMKY